MSGWMDSFNQAVGLTDDPEDAKNKAINAQTTASDKTLKLQQDQFDYQKEIHKPFYDKGLQGFDAYQKNVMSGVGPDGTFNPALSDAYRWNSQQLDQSLGRNLRSIGRQNSTMGMNAMGVAKNNLISSEYDKQLARLADLTNIARGGASSLANASAGFGQQAGQNMINQGNNVANASLAGGLMKQNQQQNNTQGLYSLANLGIKAYQAYNSGNNDNWGSSQWQGDTGYNTDNYVMQDQPAYSGE